MEKNCIVAQSGGPTAAINASLAGVIQGVFCSEQFDTIYGAFNGIQGILENRIMNLSKKSQEIPHFIDTLTTSPAMYLGSCRYKLPDYKEDDEPYRKIFRLFESQNIHAFFYIGGNDSMDTVMKLGHYGRRIGSQVSIIGIPKTIDNDLCITDHTPGFGSAAKFVASSLLEIAHDTFIYDLKSVTIVEIMGRDAGWLTAASALARNSYNHAPHLIYLPEVPQTERKGRKDRSKSARRAGLRILGPVQKTGMGNVHLVVHNILAQLVEPWIFNRVVVGSSPTNEAKECTASGKKINLLFCNMNTYGGRKPK